MFSNDVLKRNKDLPWLAAIFPLFGSIYCLISLVNHYQFRTYALDLGMLNNALYCFSHFKANYFTLTPYGNAINFLGDHFSPIMFLYLPFYYLFGSYTLLLIQVAAILLGGLGIYKYAQLKFPESYIPLIILFQFFGIWGIYNALSFDFHNNVIAAMMVPWFIYYCEKKQLKLSLLFFILILISKENMALWMIFILLGLMLKNGVRNFKSYLKFELPLLITAGIYFILISVCIMPALQNVHDNTQFSRYSFLGSSTGEMVSTLIQHPRFIFALLFESPIHDGRYFAIKSELHFMVLVSGGIALLYRPYYLVMLIPIYLQKLMCDDPVIWGINAQYSIEFAPILSLATLAFIEKMPTLKYKYLVCIAIAVSTHFFNISTIDHRRSPAYDSGNTRYYSPGHYDAELNVSEIYNAIHMIPGDAPVSVSSALAPHLANRYKIYSFPVIKDAQYIALITEHRSHYPLSDEEFAKTINSLKSSGIYSIMYDKNDCLILKKKLKPEYYSTYRTMPLRYSPSG